MPEEAQAQNPFDTTAESAELEALQNELNQAQQSIESDAAKALSKQITPELEELFFEDREAFIKALFQLQNDYLAQNIKPKIERAQALGADIATKQQMGNIDKAREVFMQKHPEVDFNALMQFYTTLDANTQAQLGAETDPLAFFENLLALYKGGADSPNPPTQLQGVEANTSQNNVDGDLPMNRF